MFQFAHPQGCTPAGDQTSYGTSNIWIGYVYDNIDFTNYSSYVNEGTAGSANFDESFGGDYVNYPTNGCSVYTETFSVRYKLTKNFTAGQYQFTVGGDDGFRLSIDGGATWLINRWNDQSYTITSYALTLSGTYNMVLEYYENGGGNRVSFAVAAVCTGAENQTIYGSGDVWKGYIYMGTNFNIYSGLVTEGISGNLNFDENFGGDYVYYNTSACPVLTEQFSARYRLQKTLSGSTYVFTVGGDDGYRLSLDGGSTWVINNWTDHGYGITTYTAALSGTYNMVLEYYENGGQNRVSFSLSSSLLPVTLQNFDGQIAGQNINLRWKVSNQLNTAYYQVERSANGIDFTALARINAGGDVSSGLTKSYSYTDASPANGISYYRLQIADKDGKYNYSPVIKLAFTQQKGVLVFPSVADHSAIYLKPSDELRNAVVEVFEMTGKKLQQIKLQSIIPAQQTVTVPLLSSYKGSYIIICKSGAAIKAKQIIIIR